MGGRIAWLGLALPSSEGGGGAFERIFCDAGCCLLLLACASLRARYAEADSALFIVSVSETR